MVCLYSGNLNEDKCVSLIFKCYADCSRVSSGLFVKFLRRAFPRFRSAEADLPRNDLDRKRVGGQTGDSLQPRGIAASWLTGVAGRLFLALVTSEKLRKGKIRAAIFHQTCSPSAAGGVY